MFNLEPMIVHPLEKRTLDGVTRDRADHRVNTAFGAECCVIIVGPVFDLTRRKNLQTVKAAAAPRLLTR